jgi:hypothetical protein
MADMNDIRRYRLKQNAVLRCKSESNSTGVSVKLYQFVSLKLYSEGIREITCEPAIGMGLAEHMT